MSHVHKRQAYCPHCDSSVLAERSSGIGDGMGCLLILFTGGLFLPFFLLWRFAETMEKLRCPRCGAALAAETSSRDLLKVLAFSFLVVLVLIIIYAVFAAK
jgi:ribosomal protein S27AE